MRHVAIVSLCACACLCGAFAAFADTPADPAPSTDTTSTPVLDHAHVQRLIDRQSELLDTSARGRGIDANYQKALTMLTSPQIKKAFDLSQEPPHVRDSYGRTTYGQSCLLARRLVEAGAKFINVYFAASIGGQSNSGGWDTHGFNHKPMYPVLTNYLLPITNQTLPTLLEDLDERGLLDTTLVLWMGEFGRTPKINAQASRDHWPQCYTVLLAGGGVKRGYVHGASDKQGAYPSKDPVRPGRRRRRSSRMLASEKSRIASRSAPAPSHISAIAVVSALFAASAAA